MKNLIIFFLIIVFIAGCDISEKETIDNNFSVTYVDNPVFRNVYFQHQGVFRNISIFNVIFDNDNILIKGYFINKKNEIDSSNIYYYKINKKEYILDPSQEESRGLTELNNQKTFNENVFILRHSHELRW